MMSSVSVARLFVALPLPFEIGAALSRMQPPAAEGVRNVAVADMHITLHFIGTAEPARAAAALAPVTASPITIRLTRPGHFRLRGHRHILWVGVEPVAELESLHAKTAEALSPLGFEPERRQFRPHITLARLAGKPPVRIIDTFETAEIPDDAVEFLSETFALFASDTTPDGAHYRELEAWPLGSSQPAAK